MYIHIGGRAVFQDIGTSSLSLRWEQTGGRLTHVHRKLVFLTIISVPCVQCLWRGLHVALKEDVAVDGRGYQLIRDFNQRLDFNEKDAISRRDTVAIVDATRALTTDIDVISLADRWRHSVGRDAEIRSHLLPLDAPQVKLLALVRSRCFNIAEAYREPRLSESSKKYFLNSRHITALAFRNDRDHCPSKLSDS